MQLFREQRLGAAAPILHEQAVLEAWVVMLFFDGNGAFMTDGWMVGRRHR